MTSNGATSNGATNGATTEVTNVATAETHQTSNTPSSDLLYHVKGEIIDFHEDTSGSTRNTDIYGTYTSLAAAKAAARNALKAVGYLPSDFTTYAEKGTTEDSASPWEFGDDVLVYAKAPAGQEFRVRLDVTPNTVGVRAASASGGGAVVEGQLFYVLQTSIDYNEDAAGACQSSAVQEVYVVRKEANHAAYNVLLGAADGLTRESYVLYERQDEKRGDWPYGDHVLVHAVAENGENFRVEVRTRTTVHHKREDSHRYEAGAWK